MPNYARGLLPVISIVFGGLQTSFGLTYLQSGLVTGIICTGLAFVAAFMMKETFGKDLDYVEED